MAKVAVVFWSGTGHTEKMAHCIMDGLKAGGAEAELFTVSQFSADNMTDLKASLAAYRTRMERVWQKP